jgi:Tfp pilus assembly protein PilP
MNALTLIIVLCASLLAATLKATAQTPAPAGKGAAAAPAAPPSGPPPPTPPADYAYSPESRRDPFVSLVNRGSDGRSSGKSSTRPEGIAGIGVEEVVVRGIIQSRKGWIAMIASPAGRTYTIRAGDRLMDGNVRTINNQAVVLMQEVNDPLSLEKQREVRKFLRAEVK